MIGLRKSKAGFLVAGIFAALAVAALATHLYSVKTNAADSGESGIILLPFAMPWLLMIPHSIIQSQWWDRWVYLIYLILVAFNALIIYVLTGGMRLKK